jgi:hypothetical protein
VTDDLIKAVARAICRQPGSLCVGFCHAVRCKEAIERHGDDARAAIRAAAPMILDMAADVVDDAEYAGFVRQLKERFQ